MKKRIIFLLLGLILVSCSQTTPEIELPVEESPEIDTQPAPAPLPEADQWQGILREKEKELVLNTDQKKTIAESYYEVGYKFYLELKYSEAKENFRKALELVPDHKNAKKYLEEILALEGSYVPGEMGADVRIRFNEIRAIIEQLTLEIQNHLNQGIRYYETEDYEHAEEEFKWVIQTVKWHPYPIELSPYQKQAEGYFQKTLAKKKEKEIELKRLQEEQARKLAEKEEEKRREEFIKNIEMLFRQAHESFEAERFNETVRLCNKILEKNPANQLAVRLKDIAFQSQRAYQKRENTRFLAEEWKKTFEEYQVKITGGTELLTFPPKEIWQKIDERGPRRMTIERPIPSINKEVALILERKLIFPFGGGAPLQQIIEYIRGQLSDTGINIMTQDIDTNTNIVCNFSTPTPIKNALKDMLKSQNWDYMIQDGIVIIATNDKVFESQLETRTYDVLDLVIDIPNFDAPNISLVQTTQAPAMQQQGPRITSDELVKLIQENLGRDVGGFANAATSVEFHSPSLVVKHLPSIHNEIEQLLKGLRSAMDMVVTVESRFLEVQENFLEDVGVDILGIDGAPQLPAALQQSALLGGASFTDLTSGVYGLFYDNTPPGTTVRGDLRMRVEQMIVGGNLQDGLLGRFGSTVFGIPRTPTMSYTRLGRTQLQFILRAVEKEGRGKVLSSPKITLYNGQKGYVYISDQFAYVRDYEMTMVAPGVITADPQIAMLSLGTVLEVRPSISADLRYISMEVKPQMISLSSPFRLPNLRRVVLRVDSALPPTNVAYELPDTQYQTAQTNVIIPDGGTILIGGYHTGQDLDYVAGVPILSKIPIIGGLFSEKIKGSRRRVLLILIKGQITAMGQEEKERLK